MELKENANASIVGMDGSLFAKSACCKQLFESIAIFFVFTSYFLNEN